MSNCTIHTASTPRPSLADQVLTCVKWLGVCTSAEVWRTVCNLRTTTHAVVSRTLLELTLRGLLRRNRAHDNRGYLYTLPAGAGIPPRIGARLRDSTDSYISSSEAGL
jgi:hypothetical protein